MTQGRVRLLVRHDANIVILHGFICEFVPRSHKGRDHLDEHRNVCDVWDIDRGRFDGLRGWFGFLRCFGFIGGRFRFVISIVVISVVVIIIVFFAREDGKSVVYQLLATQGCAGAGRSVTLLSLTFAGGLTLYFSGLRALSA